MKDKLVLVKSKCNNPVHYSECYRCVFQGLSCCGTEESNSIVCEKGYNYKLQEEEPIQTEYKHKKERYDSLCKSGTSKNDKEICFLGDWLQKNKPTNFVTCTKDNTKVGDVVRVVGSDIHITIEHIFEKKRANHG